jgi:hypothetical protein
MWDEGASERVACGWKGALPVAALHGRLTIFSALLSSSLPRALVVVALPIVFVVLRMSPLPPPTIPRWILRSSSTTVRRRWASSFKAV